jgi:UDP-2,3-diacylglucosamine pyrophosphatase LpxH
MFMSDWHLDSRFAKATILRMTLRDFESDQLTLGGDIIGGIERKQKKTEHIAEGHTQAKAQVLQKADTGTSVKYLDGNHEEDMERLLERSRYLFGIEFCQTSEYSPRPDVLMLEEHGHAHDLQLFGNARRQKCGYWAGTKLLYMGSEVDYVMHEKLGLEEWSSVNWGKRRWKEFANENLGLLEIIEKKLDCSKYSGSISGHSHILGIHHTPGGKLICNSGSSATKGSEFIAYDGHNFAAVERLRDRMNIQMQSGLAYTVYFRDLGLDHCCDNPSIMDNIHVHRAEQLQSMEYALWPAKDQQEIRRQQVERRRAVDRFLAILSEGESLPNFGEVQRALLQASREVGDLKALRGVNPYPPIRGYKSGVARPDAGRVSQLQTS